MIQKYMRCCSEICINSYCFSKAVAWRYYGFLKVSLHHRHFPVSILSFPEQLLFRKGVLVALSMRKVDNKEKMLKHVVKTPSYSCKNVQAIFLTNLMNGPF